MLKASTAGLLAAATFITPVAAQAQSAAAGPPAPPSAPQAETGLQDVVVTAQRREELLKDVPIAITALTGTQLTESSVSNTLQLTNITPGLNFVTQGAYAEPTIRGIGTAITGAGADANVAIYVDGVYQPSQVGNAFEFNNIERIEVLKGPQGTLFGRNATGGAISVTTKAPSYETSGQFSAGYGSFDEVRLNGYLTGKVANDVAGSLSVLYRHDNGFAYNSFLKRRTGKVNDVGVRGKILVDATDSFSVTFAGGYNRNDDNSAYLTEPIGRNVVALQTVPTLYIPTDPRELSTDTDPINRATGGFGSITGRYKFSNGTLTSITSYAQLDVELLVDSDVTSLPTSTGDTFLPEQTFTQELNYASSNGGPLNFISGLYYYNDHTTRQSINYKGQGGPVNQDFLVTVATEAAAAFGELNYDVTSSLRLIGGLRYSTERKRADGYFNVGGTTQLHSSHRWDGLTPRASIVWKLDDRSNVYATYSRGFKSGAYNTTTLTDPNPVSPERVDAFEVGFKHSDRRLVTNLSGFYYDYQDIQVAVQTRAANGTTTAVFQNAAKARIYGADADITAFLSDNWQVRLGGAYTHAKYRDYTNALLTTPRVGGGNTQAPGDASGRDMIRSPRVMLNGTLTYHGNFSFGHLQASGTASYNSGFFWTASTYYKQPAYTIFNATASWTSPDDKYRIEIWGKNLSDKLYFLYATASTNGFTGSYQRPRAVGVTLTRYIR